jgi:hypothetical protein
VGMSKRTSSTRARTQVEAYVRRLLGLDRQANGWAEANSTSMSLPKGTGSGNAGATPRTLPKQLEATAYSRSSQKASSSSSSNFGNAWLVSPIAGTVKSILSLFGGGSSTVPSTRYRTTSRQTFRIVESISPEVGSGARNLNESAAELTGVTSHSSAGGVAALSTLNSTRSTNAGLSGGTMSQFEDRQALVTALRRSLSESRGIADVLSEFQDGL